MKPATVVGVFLLVIGIFVLLFVSGFVGIVVIAIGLVGTYLGSRSTGKVEKTGPAFNPTMAPPAAASSPVIIQREIVKVPCRYCGTLNEIATTRTCSNCGAPIR